MKNKEVENSFKGVFLTKKKIKKRIQGFLNALIIRKMVMKKNIVGIRESLNALNERGLDY